MFVKILLYPGNLIIALQGSSSPHLDTSCMVIRSREMVMLVVIIWCLPETDILSCIGNLSVYMYVQNTEYTGHPF